MDEKQFKKHLADLAHGHHHPEEHDWGEGTVQQTGQPSNVAPDEAGSVVVKAKAKTAKTKTAKSKTAKTKTVKTKAVKTRSAKK